MNLEVREGVVCKYWMRLKTQEVREPVLPFYPHATVHSGMLRLSGMRLSLNPFRLLLISVACCLNQHQRDAIED